MSEWKEFDSGKAGVKDYIDSVTTGLRISRKKLAEMLGCHNSTLHSWIPRGAIPTKYYKRMEELISNFTVENSKTSVKKLTEYTDAELIAELINRGVKVTLSK